MKNIETKKGFTLIELLIVISIIGILAVALLPSVLGAPARARDAARKSDVLNIIAAVETYNSANGAYPTASFCVGDASADSTKLTQFFKGHVAPVPPSDAGSIGDCANKYIYCKLDAPNNYAIGAVMETDGSTKGYRGSNLGAIASDACKTVAAGADASGKWFVNVQ